MRNLAETVEANPARLVEIEERIELLRQLKRKYGISESEVLLFAGHARSQLGLIESANERNRELDRALAGALRKAGSLSAELSQGRRRAATALSDAICSELRKVGAGTCIIHHRC